MDNPLLGILVSTAVTGLIQSSGATMSILLSLASQVCKFRNSPHQNACPYPLLHRELGATVSTGTLSWGPWRMQAEGVGIRAILATFHPCD